MEQFLQNLYEVGMSHTNGHAPVETLTETELLNPVVKGSALLAIYGRGARKCAESRQESSPCASEVLPTDLRNQPCFAVEAKMKYHSHSAPLDRSLHDGTMILYQVARSAHLDA